MSGSVPVFSALMSAVGLAAALSRNRQKYNEDFAKQMQAKNLLRQELEHRKESLEDQETQDKKRLAAQKRQQIANTRMSFMSRGLGLSPSSSGGASLRQIERDAAAQEREIEKHYQRQGFADDLRYKRNLLSLSAPSYYDVLRPITNYLK